jgi:DNA-binding NarL/FixJ family response regulator
LLLASFFYILVIMKSNLITLIDDCSSDLNVIKNWFEEDGNYQVEKVYHSSVDALSQAENIDTAFCLIDIKMPLLNGIDLTYLLIKKGYSGNIIGISHGYNQPDLMNIKKAGAIAYCRKNKIDILNTLNIIKQQKDCFNPSHLYHWKLKTETQNLHEKDLVEKVHLLSPIDKKILQLSSKGLKTPEIALSLILSINTINQYRSQLFQKLGTNNITHAVAWALATHTIEHCEVCTPPPIRNK